MTSHDRQLDRGGRPTPKSYTGHGWTARDGTQVSVMTADDAGVDAAEPWVASCDTHGEMLACPTKVSALRACRHRDWCSGCSGRRA